MPNNFDVRVWAVLGEGSTGKSTAVGHLVSQLGKGPAGPRWVPLRGGGYLQVHARRQSLQEAKRDAKTVVRDGLQEAKRLEQRHRLSISAFNLLMAIRTDDQVNGLPPASEYLSYLVDSGWKIESLVILDYDERKHGKYFAFGAPTLEHYETSQMARDRSKTQHHYLVGPIRNHFGWA